METTDSTDPVVPAKASAPSVPRKIVHAHKLERLVAIFFFIFLMLQK